MSVPPPPQQAPAQEATPGKVKPHVLGIIALVAAILGFIFACVPGALIIGWILLPIAFILSLVALFLKGRKWPAIVGLILAVVGTIVGFIVFFAVVMNAATTALGTIDKAPAAQAGSSSSAEPAEATKDQAPDSEYAVTIDGATQAKDYEGKSALVVTFTFTNDSDDAANFAFATSAKAFQDGIELDTAILTDSKYDSSSALKDIKPGKSIKVTEAYVLDSKAEVSVEVTELLSFDDTPIATKTFSVK